mgnify:CR=1 FL=1
MGVGINCREIILFQYCIVDIWVDYSKRPLYDLQIPFAMGAAYPFLGIVLPPWAAGAAMALSSVTVVTSSLMLKWGGGWCKRGKRAEKRTEKRELRKEISEQKACEAISCRYFTVFIYFQVLQTPQEAQKPLDVVWLFIIMLWIRCFHNSHAQSYYVFKFNFPQADASAKHTKVPRLKLMITYDQSIHGWETIQT